MVPTGHFYVKAPEENQEILCSKIIQYQHPSL